MLGNEISDYRQLKCIRKKMETDEFRKEKYFLKSLYHCGAKVPAIHGQAAVAVVANDKTARIVGVASCKSPWGCPVCTAKQMAKYAAKIACAIDALKERSYSAAMLTFTIPHTSGFTCEQATEILYKTWKAFTVHGNGKQASNLHDVFAEFCRTFDSKHRVRVTEYTFGNAGWHPHFHCLFWFPSNRINEILEWEERLNNRWLELCKRYTIRELLIGYPETQRKTVRAKVETRVNIMYEKMDRRGSNGVYISKENNLVIVQKSSDYLCGWGGDLEVTGNVSGKATAPGHYTWQQILYNAIEQDKMKLNELNPAEGSRKKEVSVGRGTGSDWWKLYFEYMHATKKARHARVNFSVHSGLNAIIAEYKRGEKYKTVLKKNAMDRRKNFGVWRVVCWFSKAQWSEICNKDLDIRILELATAKNAKELIDRMLTDFQILPSLENQAEAAKLEAILNAA